MDLDKIIYPDKIEFSGSLNFIMAYIALLEKAKSAYLMNHNREEKKICDDMYLTYVKTEMKMKMQGENGTFDLDKYL